MKLQTRQKFNIEEGKKSFVDSAIRVSFHKWRTSCAPATDAIAIVVAGNRTARSRNHLRTQKR